MADPRRQRENGLIGQGGWLQFVQGKTPAHERVGDDPGHTELSFVGVLRTLFLRLWLADDGDLIGMNQRFHRNDVFCFQVMRRFQMQGAIGKCVIEMTGRIRFEGHAERAPVGAEIGGKGVAVKRVVRTQQCFEQPEIALKCPRWANETLARECGGGESADRRPAGMQALSPGAITDKFHAAGRKAEHNTQRVAMLFGCQAAQVGRACGRSEGADDPRRVETSTLQAPTSHFTDAGVDFDGKDV